MTEKKVRKFELIHELLDIFSKLFPAILAAVIGYLGYYFQDRMSATTLISERENAESSLRSSMFQSLLGPVLAVKKEGRVDPEHERLIIELLALNFGEHFEFKPLLEHVDQSLTQQKMSLEQINHSRESLRSIARRVIQRQIAMIQNQGHGDDLTHIAMVTISKNPCSDTSCHEINKEQSTHRISHTEPLCLVSPDQTNYLLLQFDPKRANWQEAMFEFSVNIVNVQGKGKNVMLRVDSSGFNCLSAATIRDPSITRSDMEFNINWFNFPFTDNTLLADGNRFALALEHVEAKSETVVLKIVWFPKVYFSPRERPINYAEIRKKLNFK